MNILDKNQVNDQIGSLSVWLRGPNNQLIGKMQYLGGIAALDALLKDKSIDPQSLIINFEKRPKGLEVQFVKGFGSFARVAILFDNVDFWSIEQQTEILHRKSKSVVGRALLGGVLFGGVGAIIGGMTGQGDKVVKLNDIDNILSINYLEDGAEFMMLFGCKDKSFKDVTGFMKRVFNNKFKSPNDIKAEESEKFTAGPLSTADELKKWKDLLDSGAISQEEYDAQKSKILKV